MEGYDCTVLLFPPAGARWVQSPQGSTFVPAFENTKVTNVQVDGQGGISFEMRGERFESNLSYIIRYSPKPPES